uniref:Nuclear envelope phosphatase-regulatory subunit 1 n=1 Tax=Takifugu rubripes TaxID=31033 RepID=H2S433_TAKRU
MNSLEQAKDLKAFERRLTEYVSCLQPATGRWRTILLVVSVCTATGAWNWLIDPDTQKVSWRPVRVVSARSVSDRVRPSTVKFLMCDSFKSNNYRTLDTNLWLLQRDLHRI